MKKKICKYLSELIVSISEGELMEIMEIPPEEKMGDLALPCFVMAKKLHKNPVQIATELVEKLNEQKNELGIEKAENVGAYCNIYFKRDLFVKKCFETLQKNKYGVSQIGAGKTICMDYSSPNIAKNFHVGHLRTTIIGNSLYKIYQKLGYDVVRINHLGDWGTQFGKLIVAYKLWSSEAQIKETGIEELMRIYVKFENESKKDDALIVKAREWFVKMEQNDEEALKLWNWFKEISMIEFERVYKLLGVSFDSYLGESFYRDKVPALVEKLKGMELLVESQGAQVIDLEKYNMPPCLITKSDGGSIYHSRDIAAILYRKEKYDFEKCLYVTGLEQALHFKQIFKAIEVMGYDWYEGLVHVPYGLVSLAGEKLSTRNGTVIYAEDILKEAIERAYNAIIEKNPTLSDKEETAKKVGVGAVIFHDLFNQRIKNVDFSWKDVLNFDGITGPYVQYTYARAKSVLRKAGETVVVDDIDYTVLADDVTYSLVKVLAGYEDAVVNAAEKNEPSIVARYVISLTTVFNKFYHDCSILQAEEKKKKARLLLTDFGSKILCEACGLLGMECPEEM